MANRAMGEAKGSARRQTANKMQDSEDRECGILR